MSPAPFSQQCSHSPGDVALPSYSAVSADVEELQVLGACELSQIPVLLPTYANIYIANLNQV